MSKNFLIRVIKKSEYKELEIFLYEAIFLPKGVKPLSREIIFTPYLQVYTDQFMREYLTRQRRGNRRATEVQ